SLQTLEFPQVLARLARHTTFSAGRELALALTPSPFADEVTERLQETAEARYLLDEKGGLPLGGVHDIRPLARSAQRGAVLQPGDLLDILGTLRAGQRVSRTLSRLRSRVPLLADIAARIEPCPTLADEIRRCLDDQGEVLDQASPQLARLRRELRTAHERLLERLNRILANPQNAPYLQEALITQRGGRYVIPIKADFKGRIPGIVHDVSASGATLFIEPLSLVEMGNRWRRLQLEEAREVERILADLSAQVAGQRDELAWTVEALAALDLALAKGRYAQALEAALPTMVPFADDPSGGSPLDLRQARHPLLDPQKVVPIDVHLDGNRILVITGPNTGGKTVSLKTVGLMAAMAQAGLHLPAAEGSTLPLFDDIYADIGDEQSIEQSLSTFSAHLTNIVRILEQADARSLVLLDELGAGTDPVEGSALARALLAHLLARRVTTLVATHYSELKAFAQTTPGVENASLEFDLDTLSPTYRMRIGLPGRSNAFAIAERLGLPAEIVETARALVSPDERAAESLLAEIQQAHQAAVAARDEAQQARRRLAEQERRLTARLAAIEGERAAILGEARAEARRELARFRREIEALQAELDERRRQSSLTAQWLAQARERLAEQEKAAAPPPPPPPPEPETLPGEIAVGDTVFIVGLGTTGRVTALEGDSAEVQVGAFGVRVQRSDLERRAPRPSPPPEPLVSLPPPRPSPGLELDLRGRRVEEALLELDRYLDDAFLAGLPWVRIIHGKGTGALRQAVRRRLREHPLVRSYRAGEQGEGGTGVTIAYLPGD
ncbi:MAG TPA: endonuclease MutS2, partial [Anaerolineae bacterium]|nr:endonuclease MutS2 [Anaerolineae bacterium]